MPAGPTLSPRPEDRSLPEVTERISGLESKVAGLSVALDELRLSVAASEVGGGAPAAPVFRQGETPVSLASKNKNKRSSDGNMSSQDPRKDSLEEFEPATEGKMAEERWARTLRSMETDIQANDELEGSVADHVAQQMSTDPRYGERMCVDVATCTEGEVHVGIRSPLRDSASITCQSFSAEGGANHRDRSQTFQVSTGTQTIIKTRKANRISPARGSHDSESKNVVYDSSSTLPSSSNNASDRASDDRASLSSAGSEPPSSEPDGNLEFRRYSNRNLESDTPGRLGFFKGGKEETFSHRTVHPAVPLLDLRPCGISEGRDRSLKTDDGRRMHPSELEANRHPRHKDVPRRAEEKNSGGKIDRSTHKADVSVSDKELPIYGYSVRGASGPRPVRNVGKGRSEDCPDGDDGSAPHSGRDKPLPFLQDTRDQQIALSDCSQEDRQGQGRAGGYDEVLARVIELQETLEQVMASVERTLHMRVENSSAASAERESCEGTKTDSTRQVLVSENRALADERVQTFCEDNTRPIFWSKNYESPRTSSSSTRTNTITIRSAPQSSEHTRLLHNHVSVGNGSFSHSRLMSPRAGRFTYYSGSGSGRGPGGFVRSNILQNMYIEEDNLANDSTVQSETIGDERDEILCYNSFVEGSEKIYEPRGRSVQERNFITSSYKYDATPHVSEVGQFCCACANADRDSVSHIIQQLYRVVLRRTIAEAHMKLVEIRRKSEAH